MTDRPARPKRVLLLAFHLPEHPSRYRVAVWRRLKVAGATALHRAFYRLPDTELNRLRAADLAHDVENWGGTAWVYVGDTLERAGRTGPRRNDGGPSRAGRPAGRTQRSGRKR